MTHINCSQCKVHLEKCANYDGDLFMLTPVCRRCAEVLSTAQDVLQHTEIDPLFLPIRSFTEEQAKQIVEVAGKRVKEWQANNQEWLQEQWRATQMYWAEKWFSVKPASLDDELNR